LAVELGGGVAAGRLDLEDRIEGRRQHEGVPALHGRGVLVDQVAVAAAGGAAQVVVRGGEGGVAVDGEAVGGGIRHEDRGSGAGVAVEGAVVGTGVGVDVVAVVAGLARVDDTVAAAGEEAGGAAGRVRRVAV